MGRVPQIGGCHLCWIYHMCEHRCTPRIDVAQPHITQHSLAILMSMPIWPVCMPIMQMLADGHMRGGYRVFAFHTTSVGFKGSKHNTGDGRAVLCISVLSITRCGVVHSWPLVHGHKLGLQQKLNSINPRQRNGSVKTGMVGHLSTDKQFLFHNGGLHSFLEMVSGCMAHLGASWPGAVPVSIQHGMVFLRDVLHGRHHRLPVSVSGSPLLSGDLPAYNHPNLARPTARKVEVVSGSNEGEPSHCGPKGGSGLLRCAEEDDEGNNDGKIAVDMEPTPRRMCTRAQTAHTFEVATTPSQVTHTHYSNPYPP